MRGPDLFRRSDLDFIPNEGQFAQVARYVTSGSGVRSFFSSNGLALEFGSGARERTSVILTFEGSSENVKIEGDLQSEGLYHYFKGSSAAGWHTEVQASRSILYRGIYKDIDVRAYSQNGALEYDILAAPGADISEVSIRCDGADSLQLDGFGGLLIHTSRGDLGQIPPMTTARGADGSIRRAACRFRIIGSTRFGFEVDKTREESIQIDPVFTYATYLGGDNNDGCLGCAVDGAGNLLVASSAGSSDFPTVPGSYDTTFTPPGSTAVTKINTTGSKLLYSTFLDDSAVQGIDVDAGGNAYVVGRAWLGFPTTQGAYYTGPFPFPNGYTVPYVTKLNATGSALIYSSGTGGLGGAVGVRVDSQGDAFVCGGANNNFPQTPGSYQIPGETSGMFITKFNSSGTGLVFSSLFGTSAGANSISIDTQGAPCVAGETVSTVLPVTPGAVQSNYQGGISDAYMAKLSADGSTLLYLTYLGSPGQLSLGDEAALGIAVDGGGDCYVVGRAVSPGYPVTPGALDTTFTNGSANGFLSKIRPTPTGGLVYSTYLGGSALNSGVAAVLVDSSGNAFVSGGTSSFDCPTTPGAALPSYKGGATDGFVTIVNSFGNGLIYSTFVGSSGDTIDEECFGLARDAVGAIYVVGMTNSSNFPVSPHAFDKIVNNNGSNLYIDGFAAKLTPTPVGAGLSKYGSGTPGCAGPHSLNANSTPKIGNALFNFYCDHAPPDALGVLIVGNAQDLSGSDSLGLGTLFLIDFINSTELLAFDLPANELGGACALTPIPNNAALVGNSYYAQGAFLWPVGSSCSPSPYMLSTTDGVALTIQP
ncbi:MAG: hypothetical protein HY286_09940 [Planctomycetes bacterium]|nr:hypothetical protein [Planctomycetota bacterium]